MSNLETQRESTVGRLALKGQAGRHADAFERWASLRSELELQMQQLDAQLGRHGALLERLQRESNETKTALRGSGSIASSAIGRLNRKQGRSAVQIEPRRHQKLLSPRQIDVAYLVSHGLTNDQIARRLVLATGTVANHIQRILVRLGLHSRTQLAMWAVAHGLTAPTMDELADIDSPTPFVLDPGKRPPRATI